ncbi:glycosyltransferase [Chryseobacterium mulctrae]|uniref:glycosyltransferase n=1 Tax=Chryseobacterium mulctrae TaxID=2576777 RepID=UPI001115E412|nr:glycosyltransferase [Chryseobacterium mulctrae]
MKKNILFIADKPDWAYEFMIKTWVPYLQKEYNCFIAYQQDFAIKPNRTHFGLKKSVYNFLNKIRIRLSQTTKIHQISTDGHYFYPVYQSAPVYRYDENLDKISSEMIDFDLITEMAFYFQYISQLPFKSSKKIVGIFTDKFPHDGPNWDIKQNNDRNLLSRENFYNTYLKSYQHIIVGGGNLLNDYRKLTENVDFVYGIYGQENFVENKEVGKEIGLTIGWTGTPDRPMKGFRTIIEPAIENVRKSGREIRLKTKFSGSYEELYDFYSDVDCVIIASDADSGPSMYAEASLSSVPVISTKVGLPLSFLIENKNGIFIERTIESLEKAIIELYDHRKKLKDFSQNTRQDYLKVMDNNITVSYFTKILKRYV